MINDFVNVREYDLASGRRGKEGVLCFYMESEEKSYVDLGNKIGIGLEAHIGEDGYLFVKVMRI